MTELECPGLPASWLNAWLAAVGTTVLVPNLRLSWTESPSPHAVLVCDGDINPVDAVVESWPDSDRIGDMPIAEDWRSCEPTVPNIPLPIFRERASKGRGHKDAWSLSSTYTDMHVDASKPESMIVARSKLAPAAPGSNRTIHFRLARVHGLVGDLRDRVAATLAGEARRVNANGLGFDVTRITALGDASDKRVDPVIEVLAFFGLALFPIRGSGSQRSGAREGVLSFARQRGWNAADDDVPRMTWPAWSSPVAKSGIDALLDAWNPYRLDTWRRMGVHAAWKSVEFIWQGKDQTRGIGSEAL
ncbi:hypothetical protein [Candidatus Poriferisodalis sp.]|uniref:hypothetical protein n=1 Tax=Candidatus Poriferisodalis sp. TaxID=3101277 RepID=UPI003B58F8A8